MRVSRMEGCRQATARLLDQRDRKPRVLRDDFVRDLRRTTACLLACVRVCVSARAREFVSVRICERLCESVRACVRACACVGEGVRVRACAFVARYNCTA